MRAVQLLTDEPLSELRGRAQEAYQSEGVRHNGEGLTAGEYLELRGRAREEVGLSGEVNQE